MKTWMLNTDLAIMILFMTLWGLIENSYWGPKPNNGTSQVNPKSVRQVIAVPDSHFITLAQHPP
jgi:hypothetical protein